MAEKKTPTNLEGGEVIVARAKDFWEKNNKPLMIACAVIIIGVGGYYGYRNFVVKPKQEKATDAVFKAEEYYRKDSVNLALNGDGQYMGFLRIIDKFSGTDAAKLAQFYAGDCYLKLGDNEKAIKYLKKFTTSSKPLQARTYKLLGDACADLGRNNEALDYYKKSAHHFEDDKTNSADALFMAAYFADRVMKNQKEAIDLFKELKRKYPREKGQDADNYLAQLGVYNAEE
jgi:tetratricopeptide (TPR) repeat protein